MRLRVDDDFVEARAGEDVLTASIRAGKMPAGSLCMTGDCPHCLAVIDGVPYRRMCQTPVRDGLAVSPFPVSMPPPLPGPVAAARRVVHRSEHCRVVIIGGGRSGRAEAARLTALGEAPVVIDPSGDGEALAVYPGPEVVARIGDDVVRYFAPDVVVATGAADIHPVVPGADLIGILTPSAATRLEAAGVGLREAVAVGMVPERFRSRRVEGDLVRFEGRGRLEAVVVRGPDGERRVPCTTAIVGLGTYPRDALARMGGEGTRTVGGVARPPTIPECPAAGVVCPCANVTVEDLDGVWERGFRELELVKRATLAGTGTCQGGVCAPYLRAFVADRGGELQPSFTARPPARQLTLGEAADGHHFPPIQRTALDEIHRHLGARMDRMGGWWRPWAYPDPAAEYRAVREAVSLGDVGTLGKLLVRGPDAVDLLEWLYPSPIADMRPGRSRYGLLLAETGAVMDDGLVARLDEQTFYLTFTTGGATGAEAWVRDWAHARGSDVRIMDRTHSLGAINVTGPAAGELMRRAGLEEPLSFMSHREAEVAGVRCRVFRLSFTGEASYELHHPPGASPDLWQALTHLGAGLGIHPHGLATLLTLRLEKGHIIVGMDTEPDSTPRRLGMEWAVGRGKGEFVGGAALDRTAALPLDRRLTGYALEGPPPIDGSPIYLPEGEAVGRVTSATWSPTLGKSVLLAWARLQAGVAPDAVEVAGRRARRQPLPFYDPEGSRARL